jgi:hypothetical protein
MDKWLDSEGYWWSSCLSLVQMKGFDICVLKSIMGIKTWPWFWLIYNLSLAPKAKKHQQSSKKHTAVLSG